MAEAGSGPPDYDVIVIGAGIHGAGVAQAAAAAGYSVLVLEQYERPALGTSCKSSKLIHGGLRYLETGQFHLVRECLRERELLLRIAPHLVKLARFHIPVYSYTSRRRWKIGIGLGLYSLFSRRTFQRVPKRQWSKLDGLCTEGLDAVFSYYDAQTDDARLTRAVLASAQSLGVDVVFGAVVENVNCMSNDVQLAYCSAGQLQQVRARVLVNAAGPWVNRVLEHVEPAPVMPDIELVQGTHIVLPHAISRPYYLEAPRDRRAVFVTPWRDHVLVGTTESRYVGDPANVAPLQSEIDYLLEIYNYYFERTLTPADVIEAFAGLRVLPGGVGPAFGKSRDTHIYTHPEHNPVAFSIYGGKLTSYRATSAALLDRLRGVLPRRSAVADTAKLALPVLD
jgi:glycerol-3-phosphate dehydrogenase